MRMASAWLLLLVVLSNWIGGLLCFEVSYYIEIRREMNALEQAIAEEVSRQTGAESLVRIESAAVPRGHVYSDFFLFSQEMNDGETIYYTLEKGSQITEYEWITNRENNPASDSEQAILFKSLFQEFVMPQPELPVALVEIPDPSCFYFTDRQPQPFLSVSTPPPDLRA